MKIRAVRGTRDILPSDIKIWHKIEEASRAIFKAYGYQEIRTPLFEDAELFRRTVGETSEIVMKEMYEFSDKGGRTLALRP